MSPLSSRLQTILRGHDEAGQPAPPRVVRVVVSGRHETDLARVVLAPGDRLIVQNETGRSLSVTPLDFFGTTFGQVRLGPRECTAALVVTGLWFQVALHVDGREFFPLDVYLAPNAHA